MKRFAGTLFTFKNIQMHKFSKQEQLYGLNWRYQCQILPIYYPNTTSKILSGILGHPSLINFNQGQMKCPGPGVIHIKH
jgi:hypothetical protein